MDQLSGAAISVPSEPKRSAGRYYRPELDLLRLFAFLCVFVRHGPDPTMGPAAPVWKYDAVLAFNLLAAAGSFGLSIFFLLSSFLITELLLRERESTGRIHLKAFYTRRILRIWPLYYLAVAIAASIGFMPGNHSLTGRQILYLLFFLGWLGRDTYHNGAGVLWSISVEEQFYLVWPTLAKLGGRRLITVTSLLIIPLALWLSYLSFDWYNPLIQFLFFGLGALLAVLLHHRQFKVPLIARALLLSAALPSWHLAARFTSGLMKSADRLDGMMAVALIAVGCIAIFLAVYGIPAEYVPKPLVYMGKISYGLYVFHPLSLSLAAKIVSLSPDTRHDSVRMSGTYLVALGIATGISSLSYAYFEQPFLKLKERFAFVPSRKI